MAVINLALDVWLIRSMAAEGAVIANGVAQSLITIALFARSARIVRIRLPLVALAKIAACSLAMAPVIWVSRFAALSPFPAVCLETLLGGSVFLIMVRLTHVLEAKDLQRVRELQSTVPYGLGGWLSRGFARLLPGPRVCSVEL